MPTAICTDCSEPRHWTNRRGERLSSMRCLKCGGRLKAAQWDPDLGRYIVRPKIERPKLTRKECVLCGRASYARWKTRTLTQPGTFRLVSYQPGPDREVTLPAGAVVCWTHGEDRGHCLSVVRVYDMQAALARIAALTE